MYLWYNITLSGICNKCGSEDEKKIKDEKEESIEILKTLVLINNIQKYQMREENINQKLRLKSIEDIKKYFIKEISQNELISKKHKKVSAILNSLNIFLF